MRTEVTELVDSGEKRDGRGRRITPPEERAALLRVFRSSGLTAAAFARREGLKYQTFAGWVLREGREPASSPTPVRFAQVQLPSAAPSRSGGVEVVLADGTIVRGGDPRAVAEVVGTLRG